MCVGGGEGGGGGGVSTYALARAMCCFIVSRISSFTNTPTRYSIPTGRKTNTAKLNVSTGNKAEIRTILREGNHGSSTIIQSYISDQLQVNETQPFTSHSGISQQSVDTIRTSVSGCTVAPVRVYFLFCFFVLFSFFALPIKWEQGC